MTKIINKKSLIRLDRFGLPATWSKRLAKGTIRKHDWWVDRIGDSTIFGVGNHYKWFDDEMKKIGKFYYSW